jgi:Ca2+-binding RTX toxin-like protein
VVPLRRAERNWLLLLFFDYGIPQGNVREDGMGEACSRAFAFPFEELERRLLFVAYNFPTDAAGVTSTQTSLKNWIEIGTVNNPPGSTFPINHHVIYFYLDSGGGKTLFGTYNVSMSSNGSSPYQHDLIVIDIGGGDDTVQAGTIVGSQGPTQILTNTSLVGGSGNDTLILGGASDYLSGGSGEDEIRDYTTVFGDTIEGGADNDRILYATTTELGFKHAVNLSAGTISNFSNGGTTFASDTIISTEFVTMANGDVSSTTDRSDTITGSSGANHIVSGDGNDLIDAGNGNDSLSGDKGNDTVLGGAADDSVLGGLGSDSVSGGDGSDTVKGEGGDNDKSLR